MSNEKNPGWLVYIGDYTTQLYGDCNEPLYGFFRCSNEVYRIFYQWKIFMVVGVQGVVGVFRGTGQEFAVYIYISIYIFIPGTQMTLVLVKTNLFLEGLSLKIEDIHRFQVYKLLYLDGKNHHSLEPLRLVVLWGVDGLGCLRSTCPGKHPMLWVETSCRW